nr:tetratricopeptide repeat protein [Ardenticatena sp.]
MSSLANASSEFIALFKQALAAYDQGDQNTAYDLFLQASELEPDNVWCLLWLGATAPSASQSIEWLEQALALDPENPHAKAGLAWAQEQLSLEQTMDMLSVDDAALEKGRAESLFEEEAFAGGEPQAEEAFSAEDLGIDEDELPDWLRGGEEEATLTEEPAEEIPDWLQGGAAEGVESATPTQEQTIDTGLLGIDEEELPDWLRGDAEDLFAEAESSEKWVAGEQPTAAAEAITEPDWLVGGGELTAEEEESLQYQLTESSLEASDEATRAYQMGLAAYENDDLDAAARFFERTIKLNPRHVEAYNYLGSVYFLQGNVEPAIKAFETALAIDRNHAETYLNLGLIYQNLGQKQKAIFMFEQYLRLAPDSDMAGEVRDMIENLR